MEYFCLYFGTENTMYRNSCFYLEDVSDPNPAKHKVTQRPPCRSFCVQVASLCANDHNFLQLCSNIACPPTESSCTPDPLVGGVTLAADIGCGSVYDTNPYVRISAAQFNFHFNFILIYSIIMICVITLYR